MIPVGSYGPLPVEAWSESLFSRRLESLLNGGRNTVSGLVPEAWIAS